MYLSKAGNERPTLTLSGIRYTLPIQDNTDFSLMSHRSLKRKATMNLQSQSSGAFLFTQQGSHKPYILTYL